MIWQLDFWWCAFLVLLSVFAVGLGIKLLRWSKTHISPESFAKAFNSVSVGVLFYVEGGLCLLSNIRHVLPTFFWGDAAGIESARCCLNLLGYYHYNTKTAICQWKKRRTRDAVSGKMASGGASAGNRAVLQADPAGKWYHRARNLQDQPAGTENSASGAEKAGIRAFWHNRKPDW